MVSDDAFLFAVFSVHICHSTGSSTASAVPGCGCHVAHGSWPYCKRRSSLSVSWRVLLGNSASRAPCFAVDLATTPFLYTATCPHHDAGELSVDSTTTMSVDFFADLPLTVRLQIYLALLPAHWLPLLVYAIICPWRAVLQAGGNVRVYARPTFWRPLRSLIGGAGERLSS